MKPGPTPDTRYSVEFYVDTGYGKRLIKTETMTLAEIEDEVGRSNYTTRILGVVS